jgi:hypothetical protein
MKSFKRLLTCLICGISSLSLSQEITLTGQKTFGGIAFDGAISLSSHTDGSFLVGGYSTSIPSGDKTTDEYGEQDYWLIKFDDQWNELWQESFGGDEDDLMISVIETNDGGILLGGSSGSPISGNKTVASKGETDFWLVKLDMDGNELWQQSYGGDGEEQLQQVIELSNGDILLAGTSWSDVSGDKTVPSRGLSDYWVACINSEGEVLWDRGFGGDATDLLFDIHVLSDLSRVILSGQSLSSSSGDKSEDSYDTSGDCWVILLDEDWNILWDRTLGGTGFEFQAQVKAIASDIYVLASSQSDSSGTKSEDSRGGSDYWVTALNIQGEVLWDRTIGGVSSESPRSILTISSGHLLLAGGSLSNASFEKEDDSRGGSDFWPVCISPIDGSILWQMTIGGAQNEGLFCAMEAGNGRFILAGKSESGISGDKTEASRGLEDIWIVEIVSPVGIAEAEPLELRMVPNPAFEQVNVSLPSDATFYSVTITDMQGRQLMTQEINSGQSSITTGSLPAGLYTITVTDNTGSTVSQRMVKLNR